VKRTGTGAQSGMSVLYTVVFLVLLRDMVRVVLILGLLSLRTVILGLIQ